MAKLAITAITKVAQDIEAALVAADVAGDTFDSSSGLVFAVKNGDAASKTITITAPVSETQCGGFGALPVGDLVHSIPAGELHVFTIPSGYAVDGEFALSYSAITSVTVGGFSLA